MAQTQARFFTAQAEYAVPAAVLRVPTHLDKNGLSQLINKLLNHKTANHVSFEFLVEGVLLRSTVDQLLLDRGLSTENVLAIEYVTSLPEPHLVNSFTADDWISSVACDSISRSCVTSGFDGILRLWRTEDKRSNDLEMPLETKECKIQVSKSSLKTLAIVESKVNAPQLHVLTGGLGRIVTLICMESNDEAANTPFIECEFGGNESSIEKIVVLEGSDNFATASFSGCINIYNIPPKSKQAIKTVIHRKRNRGGQKIDPQLPIIQRHEPMGTLVGHSGAISSLAAGNRGVLFSGAQDCSVRQWDIETASVLRSMAADTSVKSISFSQGRNLVVSAHMKPLLRLWDPRGSAITAVLNTGHTAPISEVSWRPDTTDSHHLATASFDGSVRLFDTRNLSGPMHILTASKEIFRRFCVVWQNGKIISGGDDCKLHIWKP